MRELINRTKISDCRVDTFRVSGAGGQHRDKTSNGVRVTHPPSGAVGESREGRSQLQNKKTAFRRMAESVAYRNWINRQYFIAQDELELTSSSERIRTYNLIDRRVTDHRTKHQSSNVDAILDGDIDSLYRS
jgi:protein subunit release factor A